MFRAAILAPLGGVKIFLKNKKNNIEQIDNKQTENGHTAQQYHIYQ